MVSVLVVVGGHFRFDGCEAFADFPLKYRVEPSKYSNFLLTKQAYQNTELTYTVGYSLRSKYGCADC